MKSVQLIQLLLVVMVSPGEALADLEEGHVPDLLAIGDLDEFAPVFVPPLDALVLPAYGYGRNLNLVHQDILLQQVV